jgi:diguanylate cyclase (GGDEF)-like protein
MMEQNARRILLVEDDEEDYIITRALLAEAPGPRLDLEWAATCEEALERLARGGIDAALVDYRLGGINGLDFVREAGARGHRVPMILLTGQGDRDVDCQAMGAGASDFLVKGGMTAAALERAIRYGIERRRAEEALRAARDELAEANARLRREVDERARAEAELARLAFHDSLTGLPNRALFLDRLRHALDRAHRSRRGVAVMFLDLDNFKVVNDSLGHEAGDRLLTIVAERLRETLRDGDTVARFGGDEFTILLEGIGGERDAVAAAERVSAAFGARIRLEGTELVPRFSIGIAVAAPGRDRPDHLLRKADLALYRAKARGKGRVEVFDEHMQIDALDRLTIEADLRRALDRGELRVHYQPIVDLACGEVDGVEALVRWDHPQRGLMSPADFIPVAEETGLILPLGRWVLKQACTQVRAWRQAHPGSPPVQLSVNMSARQVQHPRVVEDVAAALLASGLEPARLTLEITESVLMQDTDDAAATLRRVTDLGARLAIDDFGTGYSSLAYLKRFPVEALKIDRSFVDGLGTDQNDTSIVRSVIALAKSLDLAVTAEGVESSEQAEHLRALGCDRAQGYYFARPLPADQIEPLLATGRIATAAPRTGLPAA